MLRLLRRVPGDSGTLHKSWFRAGIGLLVVAVLAIVGSYFVDEPLRRYVEHEMNRRLAGYSAQIGALRLHPLAGSLTLYDLVFRQDARPDPPVLRVATLGAHVHWRALFSGRLVASFSLDHLTLYADRRQAEAEARDPTPLREHGWQEAFEAIYPLKINKVTVVDGTVTYADEGPFKPLRLTHLNLAADNIRNVRSRGREYPSELHLEAVVFDSGRVAIDGHADFLTEPFPGIRATLAVSDVDLEYFEPITRRAHLGVRRGRLSADGLLEYAPRIKVVDLRHATVRDVQIEYVHTPRAPAVTPATVTNTERTVKAVSNKSDLLLRAGEVQVINGTFAILNEAASPPYRLVLTRTDLSITNVSNQLAEGTALATLRGRFMGSGATAMTATFRPEAQGPDFDVEIKIEGTDMTTMNDFLRAHGGFDVVAGEFSFYSDLHVKDGRIQGYVKPLFRDVRAYVPEQDRDKSFGRKLYERLIDLVAVVFRNSVRKEVATRAEISGPLESPHASTWQIIGKFIENAFFRAILPGFDASDGRHDSPRRDTEAEKRIGGMEDLDGGRGRHLGYPQEILPRVEREGAERYRVVTAG